MRRLIDLWSCFYLYETQALLCSKNLKTMSKNLKIVSKKNENVSKTWKLCLVRQLQSSQTLMSRILIFPLKIVQITLFMIETIIFWLGGDDLALKLEIFVLVHTQRGSWRLIIKNMRNIFLFLCINQPLWVCTRTNISNFNTKSSPPNQNIMVSIIKSVIWTIL